MSDLTLHGYAPGNYSGICMKCKKHHTADKRARHCRECAQDARITALEAENKRLREALTPFAKEAARYDPPEGDGTYTAWDSAFKIDDLRRAAAALEKK